MELKTNELTIPELKQISQEAIEELEEEEKLNSKRIWHPISYVEYYRSDFFKKNIKLYDIRDKLNTITEPLKLLGINHSNEESNEEEIFVFLDRFKFKKRIKKNNPHQLVELLSTIYHEFRHSHQREKKDKYSLFDNICISTVEDYLMRNDRNHYLNNPDEYLMEIDANLFSVKQTDKFLKKYKEVYEEEKEYIEGMTKFYQFEKVNYDFDKLWEKFYSIYMYFALDNEEQTDLEKEQLDQLVDIFFKENSCLYKSIAEICNNKNISLLDEKLFCHILGSKSFIEQLNVNNLEETEIEIMRRVIKYRLEEEYKIRKYNQKRINENNYIKETYLLEKISENKKRIKYLENTLSELQLRNAEIIVDNHKTR